jgi:hypothetical protein
MKLIQEQRFYEISGLRIRINRLICWMAAENVAWEFGSTGWSVEWQLTMCYGNTDQPVDLLDVS